MAKEIERDLTWEEACDVLDAAGVEWHLSRESTRTHDFGARLDQWRLQIARPNPGPDQQIESFPVRGPLGLREAVNAALDQAANWRAADARATGAEAQEKRQGCGRQFPCLVDIFVLAGVERACGACERHVSEMRQMHGWQPQGDYYWSDRITPGQQNLVRDRIHQALTRRDAKS